MGTESDTNRREELSPVKRALLEIRQLKERLHEEEMARTEPIAIVGIGCRFPGADSPDAFWSLLSEGREAVSDVPADRWDIERLYDPDPEAPGKVYTKRGGFLKNIDQFDGRFFGITPREAVRMDPQQRLLLEVSWEALEDAGQAPDRLLGEPVGVFVGVSANDYLMMQLKSADPAAIDAYMGTGGSAAVASGRLSYVFGFQGPSVTVDTACSASLVAVHQACQSLRARECRMALAGGVSLMLLPELTINFCRARMLAPDGHCKTFDSAADGYVRSEGCGVIVLKRLSDAVAEGNRILAVIRGSAVNQDGRSSGLTVPNGPAQEAVIRDALARGGVAARDVSYVEAHGTGTSLGDPIEVRALGSVFADRPSDRRLALGSVKTNIGHLEAAAGIAGLIKVALMMRHGKIPPHLHLRTPNPLVDWAQLPIVIPTTLTPWPGTSRRFAGVSSFGFSGTNAHVVLEEPPSLRDGPSPAVDRPIHVLPLSAKGPEQLKALCAAISSHLETHHETPLPDVCFTAGTGRSHFSHRVAVVGESSDDVRETLRAYAAGDKSRAIAGAHLAATAPEVAFLFTGQGSQYAGMGRELYDTQEAFRESLNRCAEILRPHLDRPLLSIMFADGQPEALIDETIYTQPALFALEYSLVELWRSWGVSPSIVMGHSLGEDVAACVAGVFSLEEGLPLIATRGRLMQALPRDGEMLAVFAAEAHVRRAAAPFATRVSIASINGPESVTISGERAAIRHIAETLEAERIKVRSVAASHAFHSPLMDPMLGSFEQAAARISYRAPVLPLVSNVTGRVAAEREVCTAAYWRRHVREPVRFDDSMRTLWERGCRVFVEIGPSPVLLGMGQRAVPDGATWLPSLRKGRSDWRELLTSLASLYAAGVSVDWEALDRGYGRRRCALPTYPFERERYWADAAPRTESAAPVSIDTAWARTADAAERQSREGPLDLVLSSYGEKWSNMERLSVAYMISALRQWDVFQVAGERLTVDALAERGRVTDAYRGLLRRWLTTLVAAGHLGQQGDEFVAVAPLPAIDVTSLLESARPSFTDFPVLLDYVERCGTRLVDVLTGQESPLETLFPDGSSELADALYCGSPVSRYFNGIVRAAVEGRATVLGGRPLRILEIGAGTGGTTAGLLPALAGLPASYCFTDVGPLFLSKARDRFDRFPFVDYKQLDIERHPEAQGFPAHQFDLVIAANVLHATKNLHDTLDHVAWLLAPGGALILYEATHHPIWFDITTGLITGWQRFADDLRHDVPLLAPDVWDSALRRHGFEDVRAFPQPSSPASVLGQHVLVARGASVIDGIVESGAWSSAAPTVSSGASTAADQHATQGAAFRQQLAALPDVERHERLVEFVRDRVVEVLRLDPSRPPAREQRLMDFGIDSLMAVEFRNLLTRALGLERKLPATLIFDHATVEAIATYLQKDGVFGPSTRMLDTPAPAADPAETISVESLEDMAEEDVEALLNKRLETF
jgi:acyl transferase domain-containing protein/SAM-dependent methyltransferase/acyl carrier protein